MDRVSDDQLEKIIDYISAIDTDVLTPWDTTTLQAFTELRERRAAEKEQLAQITAKLERAMAEREINAATVRKTT